MDKFSEQIEQHMKRYNDRPPTAYGQTRTTPKQARPTKKDAEKARQRRIIERNSRQLRRDKQKNPFKRILSEA